MSPVNVIDPPDVKWLKPADPVDPEVIKNSIAFECCKDVCLAMSDFEDEDQGQDL